MKITCVTLHIMSSDGISGVCSMHMEMKMLQNFVLKTLREETTLATETILANKIN